MFVTPESKDALLSIPMTDVCSVLGIEMEPRDGRMLVRCPFHPLKLGRIDRNIGNASIVHGTDGHDFIHCLVMEARLMSSWLSKASSFLKPVSFWLSSSTRNCLSTSQHRSLKRFRNAHFPTKSWKLSGCMPELRLNRSERRKISIP